MKRLTHLSLFSGIGGLDLAAERAGFRTVGQCEFADYPYKVLCKHWPDVPKWRDIRTLTGEDFHERTGLRTVDVISGGFPCQPFSVAGKRRGTEDDRYLWPEMLRAIREIRPTWVIGENVGGIISMVQPGSEVTVESQASLFEASDKETLLEQEYVVETVCRDLEQEGYSIQPIVIPACAVGAPHRRDRIWFIAHRTNAGTETMQFTGENGIYAVGTSSHTDGDRYTSCGTSCRIEKERRERAAMSGQRGGRCERFNGLDGFSRDVTDTNSKGLQGERIYGKHSETKKESFNKQSFGCIRTTWQNFPTQSPICIGDDGISGRLDGITFSKWRQESVKAYGNAIVPQVAYEIFKAIELCQ